MPHDIKIHLDKLSRELTDFFSNKKNQDILIQLLQDPDIKSERAKSLEKESTVIEKILLKKISLILISMLKNDLRYTFQFKILIERFVSTYFPRGSHATILDVLLLGDHSILNRLEKTLDTYQFNVIKLLIAYTGAIKLASIKEAKDRQMAFLSKPSITDGVRLRDMIKDKISKCRAAERLPNILFSTLTSPLKSYSLFCAPPVERLMNKKLRLAVTVTLTDSEQNKALNVIGLTTCLQASYGKTINIPNIIYQIAALYPLTDSFLDTPLIGYQDKVEFCIHMQNFLYDYIQSAQNPIKHYKTYFDRRITNLLETLSPLPSSSNFEKIWMCLLKINHWQRLSILQHQDQLNKLSLHNSLFEISYEKGAATFELIALLADPTINDEQLLLARHYGGLIQLFDDCEDMEEDLEDLILSFPADYILPTDKEIHFDDLLSRRQLVCTQEQTMDYTHKKNKFVSLLFYNLNEVISQISVGKSFFSQFFISEMNRSVLEKLLKCIEVSNLEQNQKISPGQHKDRY